MTGKQFFGCLVLLGLVLLGLPRVILSCGLYGRDCKYARHP